MRRSIHKIRAHEAHVGMHLMDGIRGRKLCEVHTDRIERWVVLVWKGSDGEFVRKQFGYMHRIKVRY